MKGDFIGYKEIVKKIYKPNGTTVTKTEFREQREDMRDIIWSRRITVEETLPSYSESSIRDAIAEYIKFGGYDD